MLDFRVLNNIKKNAIQSIKKDSDGIKITKKLSKFYFFLFFNFIPILLLIAPWFLHLKLSNIEKLIGTGIAIFTGLFFSLLLNISAKIRIEKENINIDTGNFQAFKENMKQISDITLYIIILGIKILIYVILNKLFATEKYPEIECVFTSIALFLLARFFVTLFSMLQRFFFVLRDEIKNIM